MKSYGYGGLLSCEGFCCLGPAPLTHGLGCLAAPLFLFLPRRPPFTPRPSSYPLLRLPQSRSLFPSSLYLPCCLLASLFCSTYCPLALTLVHFSLSVSLSVSFSVSRPSSPVLIFAQVRGRSRTCGWGTRKSGWPAGAPPVDCVRTDGCAVTGAGPGPFVLRDRQQTQTYWGMLSVKQPLMSPYVILTWRPEGEWETRTMHFMFKVFHAFVFPTVWFFCPDFILFVLNDILAAIL